MTCVCGLGESTETCCGPIVEGKKKAPTAEALMRSRYAAYVLQQIDWLMDSIHPDHRADSDRKSTEAWAKQSEWKGLEILSTEKGGEGDDSGTVEFKANFEVRGVAQVHHEKGRFEKKGGSWFYVDGDVIGAKPVVREGPRVGRNDPCPCGSGKKYKKCCGKAA